MKQIATRITPLLGLLAPLPVLVGSTAAAARYTGRSGEGYSLFRNTISSLGNPSQSDWATVFNLGIMASGVCITLFILGTSHRINRRLGHAIAAVGVVTTLAMICIGIFTSHHETRFEHHLSAGIAFAGILLLSSSLCVYLPFSDQNVLPRWLMVPSFLSAGAACVFIGVVVAANMQLLTHAQLRVDVGAGSVRIDLVPTLEWLVLICALGLCCATALALILPAGRHHAPGAPEA